MNLNEKEYHYIFETDLLITKISIIQKMEKYFEQIRKLLKNTISESSFIFSPNVDIDNGKIFKGDNYHSLPYVVLDYPKYFSNTDVFTLRTMFYWGNFFSVTLHLEGTSLVKYKNMIRENLSKIEFNDLYICVNSTPWEYHYNSNNYIPLTSHNLHLIDDHNFLKINKKINLHKYNDLPTDINSFFSFCLDILS